MATHYMSLVNSNPFEQEDFFRLMQIAAEAFEGKVRHIPDPSEQCRERPVEDGEIAIYANPIPENQVGFAIVKAVNGDREKMQSFMFRWIALQKAAREATARESALSPFIVEGEAGGGLMSPYVIAAAATTPVDEEGFFKPESLAAEARRLESERALE